MAHDEHGPDRSAGATERFPATTGSTEQMPATPDATRIASADETRVVPADATRPAIPVAGEESKAPESDPRWSARAAVRPAGTTPVRRPAPEEWTEEEPDDRRWLAPVILALVVMVLLAVLGAGIWLLFEEAERGSAPVPEPSSAPSPSASPSPSVSRPSPSRSEAPQVAVPDVVGFSEATARRRLDAAGLTYRVVRRVEPGAQVGTVLEVSPDTGTLVDRGSEVRLVVAAAPVTPDPSDPSEPG